MDRAESKSAPLPSRSSRQTATRSLSGKAPSTTEYGPRAPSGGSWGTPVNSSRTGTTTATDRMTRATTAAFRTESQDEIVTKLVDFAEELAIKTWNLMMLGDLGEGRALLASIEEPEVPDFVKIERLAKKSRQKTQPTDAEAAIPSRPGTHSTHSHPSADTKRTPNISLIAPYESHDPPSAKYPESGSRRGSKWNVTFSRKESVAADGEKQQSVSGAASVAKIQTDLKDYTRSASVARLSQIKLQQRNTSKTESSGTRTHSVTPGSAKAVSFSPNGRSRSSAIAKMRAKKLKNEIMMQISMHERMERDKHLESVYELLEQKRKEYHDAVALEVMERAAKSKMRRAFAEELHNINLQREMKRKEQARLDAINKRHLLMAPFKGKPSRKLQIEKESNFTKSQANLPASWTGSLIGPALTHIPAPEGNGGLMPGGGDITNARRKSALYIDPVLMMVRQGSTATLNVSEIPLSRTRTASSFNIPSVSSEAKLELSLTVPNATGVSQNSSVEVFAADTPGEIGSVSLSAARERDAGSSERKSKQRTPQRWPMERRSRVKEVLEPVPSIEDIRLKLPALASLDREIVTLDKSSVFWDASVAPSANVKWEKHHEKYSVMADAAVRNKQLTVKLLRAVEHGHKRQPSIFNSSDGMTSRTARGSFADTRPNQTHDVLLPVPTTITSTAPSLAVAPKITVNANLASLAPFDDTIQPPPDTAELVKLRHTILSASRKSSVLSAGIKGATASASTRAPATRTPMKSALKKPEVTVTDVNAKHDVIPVINQESNETAPPPAASIAQPTIDVVEAPLVVLEVLEESVQPPEPVQQEAHETGVDPSQLENEPHALEVEIATTQQHTESVPTPENTSPHEISALPYPEPSSQIETTSEITSSDKKVPLIPIFWEPGTGTVSSRAISCIGGAIAAEEEPPRVASKKLPVVPLKMDDLFSSKESQVLRVAEGQLHRQMKWINTICK
ncbi:hypothetical protein BJ741DRAFT_142542 [Chytriomyces cf. hyalinus JEL632]|nr:hypothetical protein BJ741DRAFT_142542 [Chytriomyces cf. hyalinus JEL632]